tara:strand:+ start:44 stop:247 length:204 start_codon:yes stop_codon:yes gene_type:complete
MNKRKMSWEDWKKQVDKEIEKEMESDPVFEKGYPSHEAVNRKKSMKLRYSEAYSAYMRNWMNEHTND